MPWCEDCDKFWNPNTLPPDGTCPTCGRMIGDPPDSRVPWHFWILVVASVGLGYLGSQPPEGAYVIAARILTVYYFAHFLIIMPLLGLFESPKPRPPSIAEAVLGGSAQPVGSAAAPQTRG